MRSLSYIPLAVAVAVLCLTPLPANAALVLGPKTVTLESPTAGTTINVNLDGESIPATKIKDVTLRSEGYDYTTEFVVEIDEGKIKLEATPDAVSGVYQLTVTTEEEEESIPVYVRLQETPADRQAQAAAADVPYEEFVAPLGDTAAAQEVDLVFPPVWYVGRPFELPMETPEERQYAWRVNNTLVMEGTGPHTFRFVFEMPGIYAISYVELENGAVVAYDTATIRVVGEPPQPRSVLVGEEIVLTGPEGFQEYQWTINGRVVSEQIGLSWTFAEPGEYLIQLQARALGPDENDAFRTLTFPVVVQPVL